MKENTKPNSKKDIVFIISLLITIVIVALGFIIPEAFGVATNNIFKFLVDKFGWFYLLSMFTFVVFSLGIAFSKYGKIKLGPDDSKPEYSTKSWFAMLFAAGMGIGLVFWGVAEPLQHYMTFGANPEAANMAMRKSFMHWGFHPWAGYAVIGMALAYFQFRKKSPGLISSIFLPILGEKGVRGPIGKTIDIIAIFATVAGVATSLGQGTLQINSGLNHVFGIPTTAFVQIIIIVVIGIIYTWSAVSGIDKGIKKLSDINMIFVLILLGAVFLLGPKIATLNSFTNSVGSYINNFIQDSFAINAYGDNSWLGSWTIFYWGWWISWGPFVGTFIARISRGRTIKEFVLGVIVAPSVLSFIWFSVFGNLGLSLKLDVIKEAVQSTETAFFVVLSQYPLATVMSVATIILLCTLFITSANSATFVLSMLSTNGDLNPPNSRKILWGIVQALLALVLLLTGGLAALQTISIVAAFPFAIIMLLTCYCLVKALREDPMSKIKKLE